MKFSSYATRIEGQTAYIYGGSALDLDLQGGLEEKMSELIDSGIRRIVLTMGTMRFLHYTLFSGLLSIERQLSELKGDLVLAEVPWFVQNSLDANGVLHRFSIVEDAATVKRAEAMKINLDQVVIPG